MPSDPSTGMVSSSHAIFSGSWGSQLDLIVYTETNPFSPLKIFEMDLYKSYKKIKTIQLPYDLFLFAFDRFGKEINWTKCIYWF